MLYCLRSLCSMFIHCFILFSQQEETIEELEQNIKAAREAALDAADTDSVITGTSITGGQEGTLPNFFFTLFLTLFINSETVPKLQINKTFIFMLQRFLLLFRRHRCSERK